MINCVDEMKRWFIMRSVELKVYASIYKVQSSLLVILFLFRIQIYAVEA